MSLRAKDALDAIPRLLERFRQSVLAAAFRGDLTAEWRAKNPDVEPASELLKRIRTERRRRWQEAELAKLKAKGKTPGDDRWKAKYEEPPVVDTEGLADLPCGWSWASVDELSWSHDSQRVPIKQDERTGRTGVYPYYGAFGIIDHIDDYIFDGTFVLIAEDGKNLLDRRRPISLVASDKFWVNNHAHVLEPLGSMPCEYLSEYFNSFDLRDRLTGIDQVKLTAGALATVPVAVAPAAEQEQIAALVCNSLFRIRSLTEHSNELVNKLGDLESACLAAAFRGELVPQDPTDEPASALLARIAAERAAAPNTPSRTPDSTSSTTPARRPRRSARAKA